MNSSPETALQVLFNFLSQSRDAIVIIDEEDMIQWVNKKASKIFRCSREDMAGLPADRFSLSKNPGGNSEYITADGSRITIRKNFIVTTVAGSLWKMITVTDITIPNTFQSDKDGNRINTPVITDTAAVNVWSIDTSFNYTFFNDNHKEAMKNVWGAEIVLGNNILEYLGNSGYLSQVKANYYKLLDGSTHRSVDHFTTLSGEEKYYENFGHPIKNPEGEITGIMFYTTEITGKMEIENRLKLTISLLESIINSPDEIHIFSLDTELRYIFFNNAHISAVHEIWNTTPEIGQEVFKSRPDAGYWPQVEEFYSKTLKGETQSTVTEFFNRKGEKLFFTNISSPIFTAEGEVSGITVFTLDITDRIKTEKKLRQSLNEQEILLKEIHHRVKNNIQMITSMMNLQLDLIEDKRARHIIQDSLSRVNTMGLIHKALYQGKDLAKINMKEYCGNLLETIIEFYHYERKKITIKTNFDHIDLEMDQAIPVGLIINELITNSMKYAFVDSKEGIIILNMNRDPDGKIHLHLSDNGKGLPESLSIKQANTLGLRLLEVFVGQLNGRMDIVSDNGFRADIFF